jgi:hypothetical protein
VVGAVGLGGELGDGGFFFDIGFDFFFGIVFLQPVQEYLEGAEGLFGWDDLGA